MRMGVLKFCSSISGKQTAKALFVHMPIYHSFLTPPIRGGIIASAPDIGVVDSLQIVAWCDGTILPDEGDGVSYLHFRFNDHRLI